ncbi:hypothetical protein [Bradyrhizobium sp. CCGUVB23]|uniref:hypothetical protein n=1 Tax=Bradyrhizobium sp. CCGUVB23 TaxID=2949630 RepID=UPI0020B36C80|nr:hypothetical protein [Bradyrhizobium sp. CCGUVB23]MCP3460939.1 hypothetical protein [Bradyrhizobium sp. CCGUVB23]
MPPTMISADHHRADNDTAIIAPMMMAILIVPRIMIHGDPRASWIIPRLACNPRGGFA